MKPYYEHAGQTIYNCDCEDYTLGYGEATLIQTDPPYAISSKSNHVHKEGKGTRRLNFFDGDTDWTGMTAAVLERLRPYWQKVNACYVWCGHRQFGHIVEALESDDFSTRFLVWSKQCPVPAPPNTGWNSAAELCVYGWREGRKWKLAPPSLPNIILADSYRFGQPGKVDHPTQKPIATIALPMLASTDEGDLVIDPFMGSGTTLFVAKQNGRRAIGIEKEERYCEIAARRLSQEVMDFA